MGKTVWSCVRRDARDATTARREVREFLSQDADDGSDLDGAETIVGELVANVIRHAPGPIGVYCSWDENGAVLVVSDRGPGIPALRSVPDGHHECGRGLLIVLALARRLTVERSTPYGSRVVVQLPVNRRAA
ncbi:MAG TPA: ATP-binding protein [Dongiaceae bacterium]|nr:ATP-binding protein [Dongiaceae bacterium]